MLRTTNRNFLPYLRNREQLIELLIQHKGLTYLEARDSINLWLTSMVLHTAGEIDYEEQDVDTIMYGLELRFEVDPSIVNEFKKQLH